MKCRICGNTEKNQVFEAHEMMFGSRDGFTYFLCADCGCLQIAERPAEMAQYYAGNYYSHQTSSKGLRSRLESKRDLYALTGRGLLGRAMHTVFPNQAMRSLRPLRPALDSRILDVGCGSGELLRVLHAHGYTNLLGADPFSDEGMRDGVEIRRQSIEEVKGLFDVIMFHHSFEHLWDPAGTLKAAHGLLENGGQCLVRVPVVPSWAWNHYGVHWVQLDAPRHFYLHSVESLRRLAVAAGFDVDQVVFDSTAFQFWGSEQYKQDIPLLDDRSFFINPLKSPHSMSKIPGYSRRARALNAAGDGDQVSMYLVKSSNRGVE